MYPIRRSLSLLAIVLGAAFNVAHAAPVPVAAYSFNNTLDSSVGGAPALTAVDPLGRSGFGTDVVFGNNRTVYNFNGGTSPNEQGGLLLNTQGLLTSNSVYSVEMVFKFTQREGAWRRILDAGNRQSDSGFYVNTGDQLAVYPVNGGASFSNDVYHDVFLVDNNGSVSFYLDGSVQATHTTTVMNIDANNLLSFFLDNVTGGGIGEYSIGSVASIRLYNEALNAPPPAAAPIPEPVSLSLLALAFAGMGVTRRRRLI